MTNVLHGLLSGAALAASGPILALVLLEGRLEGLVVVAILIAGFFTALHLGAHLGWISSGAIASVLSATLGFWLYVGGWGPNLPIGYYGKQNRILTALERCQGVHVKSVVSHTDLSLEDFWVTVRTERGEEIDLSFENANIRSFSDLRSTLREVGCP